MDGQRNIQRDQSRKQERPENRKILQLICTLGFSVEITIFTLTNSVFPHATKRISALLTYKKQIPLEVKSTSMQH